MKLRLEFNRLYNQTSFNVDQTLQSCFQNFFQSKIGKATSVEILNAKIQMSGGQLITL